MGAESASRVSAIYSIGNKFGGAGIGTTAYRGAWGLYRRGMLRRVLCGAYQQRDIPRVLVRELGLVDKVMRKLASWDQSGRLWHLQELLFDAWAARHMEPADVLVAWGNYALKSLQRARARGMKTFLIRASAHPRYQTQVLAEEYKRWGLGYPVQRRALERSEAELKLADYVLIPSEFVQQSFLSQGFAREKLILIPYGVNIDRFRPAEKRSPRPFTVLFVGQVGIRKGIPYLLRAWAALNWKDAELWVVGRVLPEAQPIVRQYRNLPGLRMIEHKDDPVSLFQQADVFVFPSIEEGSALVTYEALACGLPVVTTPSAGSVIRDRVEGFLVEPRDVDAIASSLERLRTDDSLRQAMSEAARRRAEEFTWTRHEEALADFVESIA